MDFIVLSAIIGITVLWIVITYDIGCQWSQNLQSRMGDFPEHMRITEDVNVEVGIPSWHITGHGKKCQDNYNLGYMKGTGRTCGEEIESSWSHTNPLAASVREMGPGVRHETLNDHWNGWNHRKVVGMRTPIYSPKIPFAHNIISSTGVILRKKFTQAANMKVKHETAYQQLKSTFSTELVQKWEKRVEKWENDPKTSNPYTEPSIGRKFLSLLDIFLMARI